MLSADKNDKSDQKKIGGEKFVCTFDPHQLGNRLALFLDNQSLANLQIKNPPSSVPKQSAHVSQQKIDAKTTAEQTTTEKKSINFFQSLHQQRKVLELLNCVREAKWKNIEKIMKQDPNLMFEVVESKKADGSIEKITPLKYAFKIWDKYSLSIFLQYAQSIKKKSNAVEQLNQQKEHIDLTPFFAICEQYEKDFTCWEKNHSQEKTISQINDNVSDFEKLETYWRTQHGGYLNKLAQEARHFLREMCGDSNAWEKGSLFDNSIPPYDSKIHDIYNNCCISLDSFSGLGIEFSLIRGTAKHCTIASSAGRESLFLGHGSSMRRIDLEAFRRLFKKNQEFCTTLLLQLQQAPQKGLNPG